MGSSKQIQVKLAEQKNMLIFYKNELKQLPNKIEDIQKSLQRSKDREAMLPIIIDKTARDIEYLILGTSKMREKEKLEKKYYREKEKLYKMQNDIRKIK